MRIRLFFALVGLVITFGWSHAAAYAQNEQFACIPLTSEPPATEESYTLQADGYVVENQAMIFGLEEDVNAVLQELDPDLEVTVLRSVPALRLLEKQIMVLVRTGNSNRNETELVFELYRAIAQLQDQQALQGVVTVDFNALVDLAQHSVHGAPHSVAAHPFGSSLLEPLSAAAFTTQWAFTATFGVGLVSGPTATRTVADEGHATTHVALFDTSPYEIPGLKAISDLDVPGNADRQGMILCVSHPPLTPLKDDHEEERVVDVRDHGLFVAGLAHAVAPGVSLDLVKVLNEHGHGHLFALLEGLTLYLNDALDTRGDLRGTVINLSLGVTSPPTTTMPAELVDQINILAARVGYPSTTSGALPIFALHRVLEAANYAGAMIVAAAGNDVPPTATQTPANYAYVIGVAATAEDGSPSCFSNPGKVAAPGGNGVGPGCDATVISDPVLCNPATCPYALISLVLTDPTPGNEQYDYAYWLGSSFATPLVSGMTALGHENFAPWGFGGAIHSFFLQLFLEYSDCPATNGGLLTLPKVVDGVSTPCPP